MEEAITSNHKRKKSSPRDTYFNIVLDVESCDTAEIDYDDDARPKRVLISARAAAFDRTLVTAILDHMEVEDIDRDELAVEIYTVIDKWTSKRLLLSMAGLQELPKAWQ